MKSTPQDPMEILDKLEENYYQVEDQIKHKQSQMQFYDEDTRVIKSKEIEVLQKEKARLSKLIKEALETLRQKD